MGYIRQTALVARPADMDIRPCVALAGALCCEVVSWFGWWLLESPAQPPSLGQGSLHRLAYL